MWKKIKAFGWWCNMFHAAYRTTKSWPHGYGHDEYCHKCKTKVSHYSPPGPS